MKFKITITLMMAGCVAALSAQAQQPSSQPEQWFALSETGTTFLTGDTWQSDGVTYRLYGVQACLRNTYFTNQHGLKRDCGEASLAMTIAMIRDLKPQCYPIMKTQDGKTRFLVCSASVTSGQYAGSRLDFGTALITSGFAFASLGQDGKAVHQPYLVAQIMASKKRSGLWQFADVPDPNRIILKTLRQIPPGAGQESPSSQ